MKIIVKSDPEYFEKERSGIKPNTVRQLDGRDTIDIINSETGEHFERIITDLSIWNGTTIVISFIPFKTIETKTTKKKSEKKSKKIKKEWRTGRPMSILPEKLNEVLEFIKTKQHSTNEIREKFNLKGTNVYRYLNMAGVKPSEIPANIHGTKKVNDTANKPVTTNVTTIFNEAIEEQKTLLPEKSVKLTFDQIKELKDELIGIYQINNTERNRKIKELAQKYNISISDVKFWIHNEPKKEEEDWDDESEDEVFEGA
jgi:transposase